jgi:Predicted phosphoesterases, related to the Icc protein
MDLCTSGERAGDPWLKKAIQERIKPMYHIFGHIHETYGVEKIGETTFINASICTEQYQPINKPIVFELPVRTK